MKNRQEMFEDANGIIRQHVPKWKVISKGTSKLHKILSWLPPLIFFRTSYLGNFWTTIGFTAGPPAHSQYDWETVWHEGKHGKQAMKWTRALFGFLYLFPQSFLIPLTIILGLFLGSWWWLTLLVAVAPLPAPFRMVWELQAYKISVMIWTWRWGRDTDKYIVHTAKSNFRG